VCRLSKLDRLSITNPFSCLPVPCLQSCSSFSDTWKKCYLPRKFLRNIKEIRRKLAHSKFFWRSEVQFAVLADRETHRHAHQSPQYSARNGGRSNASLHALYSLDRNWRFITDDHMLSFSLSLSGLSKNVTGWSLHEYDWRRRRLSSQLNSTQQRTTDAGVWHL